MSDKKLSDIEEYFGVGAEDWEYEYEGSVLTYDGPENFTMARFKSSYGPSFIEKFTALTPIKPKQEPEFKLGDEVEVRNQRWRSAIFIADKRDIGVLSEQNFIVMLNGSVTSWSFCRHKPKTLTLNGKEYTREELEARRDEINSLLEDV